MTEQGAAKALEQAGLKVGSVVSEFADERLLDDVFSRDDVAALLAELRAAVQARVRRNFGFLFSYLGRALFVAFSGSMAVAMAYSNGSASIILIAVGVATMANALVNLVIITISSIAVIIVS